VERSYGADKKEEKIGFEMTTKEKAYPYLKNSTIEKESKKLMGDFSNKTGHSCLRQYLCLILLNI
jgi:hypothetical protein